MTSTKEQLNRVKLYAAALSYLGQDASPNDTAPDEYGCADTVSCILLSAFGPVIYHTVSTAELYKQLNASKSFSRVSEFRCGDIIISPTGYASKPKIIPNGHVGIVGENEEILSNSSGTGLFTNNFTVKTWVDRYRTKGGYPIYFFRKI